MKKTNRVKSIFLALVLGATMAMPLFGCDKPNNDSSVEEGATTNVISASLLEGKVANLMSANGIAIQNKTENEPTVSAMKTKMSRNMIVAHAEDDMIEQPETEFVKQTEEGVQDVHFHDGEKGDYTEWNGEYEVHHHSGVVCETENCTEISDEILAEEEEMPTIISLDARVNKLYNAGKFTFLCVSSAVEGQVRLITQKSKIPEGLSQQFLVNYGAYLNVDGHYFAEDDPSYTVSYMEVKAEDKEGLILVKRSESEEAYHYSNYWSDDFNQSYIIDNETGKTYSLSELPHIYSVQNGAILVKEPKLKIYQPKIVEDELVLDEVQISDELSAKYGISDPLIDRYGNVVFTGYSRLEGVDEYGELREGGFIFTSTNPEIAQQLQMGDKQFASVKVRSYTQARRYLLGSDGRIYRFDYRGETNSIPVHVLNEQGEWTNVPETAHVVFSGKACWFTELTVNVARQQYLMLTQIKGGKSYFINAALGKDLRWTMNTMAKMYNEAGYFVGVSALPTDGSADTGMQEFMQYVKDTNALDNDSIVYRVGATAFAYEDKSTNELVVWDRATETRQKIAMGEVIEGSTKGWHLSYVEDRAYQSTCFQANTADGAYYVEYEEKNPAKAWNEYSKTPIEKTEKLDAFYELLIDKLNNAAK